MLYRPLFLPCPPAAIQRHVLFVSLDRVNAGYVVQNVVIADNMGGRQVCPIIDCKQDFFLVVGGSVPEVGVRAASHVEGGRITGPGRAEVRAGRARARDRRGRPERPAGRGGRATVRGVRTSTRSRWP